MRTVCTDIFEYSELSESAQASAREWYRSASVGDNFFSECVIEDALQIAEILGIDIDKARGRNTEPAIYWSGFASQGDGASFTGSWAYAKGSCKAIRAYAPQDTELHRIADALQRAAKSSFYRVSASVTVSGHYSHSHTMRVSCDDCTESTESDITDLLRDFADWIYKQLETEYDYQNSDSAVAETIEANEYEFTEQGARA